MTRRERGFTVIELLIYLSIATIGLSAALSLYHAGRFAGRAAEESFAASRAVSAVLFRLGGDLRDAERVVPREGGPGALVFRPGGDVVVWFDRTGSGGEIHRKVLGPDGAERGHEVVARGITSLAVAADGPLVTARAAAGRESREVVVRCRHAR
jgi:type II secretory pathway component PulJ